MVLVKEARIQPPVAIIAGQPTIIAIKNSNRPPRYEIPAKDSIIYSLNTKEGRGKKIIYAPETRPINYYIDMQKFGVDQGLFVGAAISCYVDSRSLLWIGTKGGGASCYDGKKVINFTAEQGLGNNVITGIVEDKDGNIWFGCDGGGLSRYDGRSIKTFTINDGLINNEVKDIAIDQNNCIWMATRYGASSFDGKKFKNFTIADGLVFNDVQCCSGDKKGNIWIGTDKGLSCYNGKSFANFTTADGLPDNSIVCIKEDSKSNIWLGTRKGGVSMYNGKTFTNFKNPELVNHSIHSITEDGTGNLWFGTYHNGAFCYDGKTLTHLSVNQGLVGDIVSDISQDQSGNLWMATFDGTNCYPGDAFVSFSKAQGLTDNTVRSILEDRKGNYWFGTNSGFVCKLHDNEVTIFNTWQGINHNRVHRILEDNKNNIWFCTGDGVSCFDGKSMTNYNTAQGLSHFQVRCILQDKENNIWFGTEVGLSKFDGKSFFNYTTQQGLLYNNVRDMVEDKDGNLWLGLNARGGISRYDGKTFINLDTAQGLTDTDVNSMTIDSKGNIWVGTANRGISILRNEVAKKFRNLNSIKAGEKLFENFTTVEGLSNSSVWDVVEDKQGNIIIGTNEGLTVIKGGLPQGKTILKENIEWYNRKTGYPVNDVNTQAMYVDSKGYIWVGTGDKLIRFNYPAIHKNPNPPDISIQALKINKEKVGWYNLLAHKKNNEIRANDFLPAIQSEEISVFGKLLTTRDRDSLLKKFNAVQFDSVNRFYPVPVNPVLPYQFNNISFDFATIEPAKPQFVRYQYMLEGYDEDWSPITDQSSVSFGNIYEGDYTFKVKARSPDGVWSQPLLFSFTVLPPYWRTWWFRMGYIAAFVTLILLLVKWRINTVKKNEQRKLAHQKELLEMEARALRAQMNPHFIFNCLNSIKALMQQQETEKGINYLTTFSKLIRTLFHNSDKRQISLYDEIETCKLYTQLEAMRLNKKLHYHFNIDPNLDLKSVMVPALIVQPFIENAIWHGIVPKDSGTILVSVKAHKESIVCEVEDDGIGREMSRLNKPNTPAMHESKGVHLSQQRLNLEKTLNATNGSIEIIDKYENNMATGTKVILTFNLN